VSAKLSAYHITANQLRTTCIDSVKVENPSVKTFTFKDELCAKAKPGQFLMLWIPGIDEIPLSIMAAMKDGTVSVAVKKVGEATGTLHNMKTGELVGVRGPFGNSFTVKKKKILMVGGGTGTAPLFFLARGLSPKTVKPFFVMGAKTKDELLFANQLQRLCGKRSVMITTEDGGCGITGLCTEPLEQILVQREFDMIYSCGPEKMILKVFELAEKHGIGFEASLERLMRCAIGLCGSCVIGKYRVCRDGPVFNAEQLRGVRHEFGSFKRDFDGREIPL
jgi:dihydroorotate dehydrogenase electron transfer subunit